MRKETSVLCSRGDDQLLAAIVLSRVEVLIPPTPPLAAGRSFHSGHLYSICVNVVGCLVLPSTCFVTVFFHVLIRLLQNPIGRLPKMSHVCRHGCLQDVSAQRCGAVREAWETTTLAQHNSLFIRQNALVEQGGASGSALAVD